MVKIKKYICIFVCALLLVPMILSIAACGSKLTFEGKTLESGKVGVEYSQQVTATGADGITYALATGSALPAGLTLSADGKIEGIPAEKADGAKFTVTASVDGSSETNAEFSITIAQGTIAYEGGNLTVTVNQKSDTSVATATGAGSAVTYTLKSGQLPTGLTLQADGKLSGTPTVIDENCTFTVMASSKDCASADASFTVKVTLPSLAMEGTTLSNGRVNEFFGEQLPTATGTDGSVTYAVKDGSSLPAGLELSATGYLSGTPTTAVVRHKFTVVASAEGFTSAEAEFTVTVMAAAVTEFEGNITYKTKTIPNAYVGEAYRADKAVKNATTDNFASVNYAVAADSSLPEGFELFANGDLRCENGAVTAGTFTFKVTASAEKCQPVTTEFTITILPAKLVFKGGDLDTATVEENYTGSVATATAPNGGNASVTYTVKNDSLPAGLTLSAAGQISGAPVKSAKSAMIVVTASAEGFTAVDAYFYIHIQDKIVTVSDGIFEAEYIDLTGIKGEGWSGSAFEEKLVQKSAGNAHNDYFVGWTLAANTYTFKFNSSAAVTGAGLKISLASELGSVNVSPAEFGIVVNGTELQYGSFAIAGVQSENNTVQLGNFQEFTVTANGLNLIEGENIIQLVIKENHLMAGGRIFGPAMDCIKIENFGSAVFTWRPCLFNLYQDLFEN